VTPLRQSGIVVPREGYRPESRVLDTEHFALEEDGDNEVDLMRNFLRRNVKR
jgi:hypothetical protein